MNTEKSTAADARADGLGTSRTTVPRLALSPEEAAEALSVSRDFLDKHVMPELRVVRLGRRRLVPVAELRRWLDRSAARTVER